MLQGNKREEEEGKAGSSLNVLYTFSRPVQPAWPWHDEGLSADSTGDFRTEPWRGSGKTSGSATLLAVRSQASVSAWPQFFYL